MRSINKKVLIVWVSATVGFLLISWLHMGPSLTHCSTVVLGDPGDHTAGIMYNSWVSPSSPVLGFTQLTNYPFGENLWQPLALSSQVPSTGHWILSRATNVVCGWNLMVLLGYMSSALVMFGFMRWLTKNSWAAFFAAYAMTYTPYHAFASRGQLAGLLGAIFVLALWQFIDMWRKPTWQKSVRLGLILGLGFYTDGYFVLIGLIMLLSLWVASLSYGSLVVSNGLSAMKHQLISLALASVVSFITLLPLAWVNFYYSPQINSIFSNARGSIGLDAQTYSAQLSMYFNPTSLLFLGFSVILLAVIGLWFMALEYKTSRRKRFRSDSHFFVSWTATILMLLPAWISLRPKASLWGVTIYNPSSLIISLTSSWRVFGRLYALVVVGVVTLAGIAVARLMRKYPNYRYVIVGICILIVVLEFRLLPPTVYKKFDYSNAPQVYSWLNDNPQIQAIAEYPLDEPPQGKYLGSYYTYQQISNKPILNTLLPNSLNAPLRRSIVGINDPQTLPVLRALGVGLVNIRPVGPVGNELNISNAASLNPELEKVFSDNHVGIDSFLIKEGPIAKYALTIPALQYFQISLTVDGSVKYMVDDDTVLEIVKLPGATDKTDVNVAFNINADSERQATIIQNGAVLWSGTVTPTVKSVSFRASPDYPLAIHNQKTHQPTNVNLFKLRIVD